MSHPHISTATTSEFPNAVLEQSRSGPVLVDFWAEWCGPCKSLAPTLEALADKLDGALKIVKVDTDAEPEIATQYAIRSLPTLMLFKDGTNVGQVVGAQPLSELEKFVAAWLPRPADKFIDAAETARDQGDSTTAIEAFERAIELDPLDFSVHPILGGLYIDAGRVNDARALLRALPANMAIDKTFDHLKSRLNMADAATNTAEPTDDIGHAFAAAVASANGGDYDAGVSALIGLLPAHRDWQGDAVRKALVDIFNVLDGDPRVRTWRTQMARELN
jgi:putative thioredoxin